MRLYIFFLLIFKICISQTIQIAVDKNKIKKDETITLSIEVIGSNDFPKVDINQIKKSFDILSGPSQQTNIQWINGNMSSTKTLTWTISPISHGELIIPPIKGSVDGKNFQGKSIKISVSNKNDRENNRIFIKAEIDKNEVYLGEQITLTYNLYKNINASIEPFQMPEFPGFWIEDIFTPQRLNYQNITIDGVKYQVAKLGQKALFPIISNKHSIPILKIKAKIEVKKKKRSRDPFFDPFFDSFFTESKTKILNTEKINIKIKELPPPIPVNFNGAIGEFNLASKIDRDTIRINEGFSYTIYLEGTGNLGLFSLPKIKFPSQLEVFPPVSSFEKDIFRNQFTGNKTWEYVLIPRKSGTLELPGIEMSYFDPNKKKWLITNTKSIVVDIIKDNFKEAENLGFKKEEIEFLEKDIRFISEGSSNLKNDFKKKYIVILTIYLVSIILLVLPIIIEKILGYRVVTYNLRKSRSALNIALKLLKNKNSNSFEVASNAFYNYLKYKMNLNTFQLDPSKVKKILENKISKSILDRTIKLLKLCDIGKYGIENIKIDQNILVKMKKLLKDIDREIK